MGFAAWTGTSSGNERAMKECRMPMPAPERTASTWPSAEEIEKAASQSGLNSARRRARG